MKEEYGWMRMYEDIEPRIGTNNRRKVSGSVETRENYKIITSYYYLTLPKNSYPAK